MIELPYGLADFQRIRTDGMLYIDRTAHLRDIERLGSSLVFLRPRRFGKSLWLQTLASYWDLRRADDFSTLFDRLEIGSEPTATRNSYFVLQWNFSEVSARGDLRELTERLHRYVNHQIEDFLVGYEGHLSGRVPIEEDATFTLRHLLAQISKTPHRLCLLIDEYDNFVNELMVRDSATYRSLVETDGPFKELFKSVKSGTEGQGLERVFVTGVSPVALNDLTSGFNNARDVSHHPALAALCGFREVEIRDLLERIASERHLDVPPGELLETLRTWYNGYRFVDGVEEPVYNPTNVLYFFSHLAELGRPPDDLHDQNLRTDRGKLAFLARTSAGAGVIEQLTEGDSTVRIRKLERSFSLADLQTRLGEDRGTVASMLYYMGLLTHAGGMPPRLRIPNLVVRKLFLDRLLEIYLPVAGQSSEARELASTFLQDGDLSPLLEFFEKRLLPVLSNRDRGGVNETVIKTLFLSVLFDDQRYAIFSELEADHGYADLCLLVRPEMRRWGFFDMLFEFKLVRRAQLGRSARELRGLDEPALRALPAVARALRAVRQQAQSYRDALETRFGDALTLRTWVAVAVGLERIVADEI